MSHLTTRGTTRRFFGVATEVQTYRNVLYLLLGLPIGTAWFALIVTYFTVSASLVVVALIGIPMLLGCWYATHGLALVDRHVAIGLLRIDMAPLAPMTGGRQDCGDDSDTSQPIRHDGVNCCISSSGFRPAS